MAKATMVIKLPQIAKSARELKFSLMMSSNDPQGPRLVSSKTSRSLRRCAFSKCIHFSWLIPAATGTIRAALLRVKKVEMSELGEIGNGQEMRSIPSALMRMTTMVVVQITLRIALDTSHIQGDLSKDFLWRLADLMDVLAKFV
jgi:hypothetical protein